MRIAANGVEMPPPNEVAQRQRHQEGEHDEIDELRRQAEHGAVGEPGEGGDVGPDRILRAALRQHVGHATGD